MRDVGRKMTADADRMITGRGVIIVPVKSGWYRDHFKWGRDIMRTSA